MIGEPKGCPKVICVVGTRPEVIKMAPVVKALRGRGFAAPILATAQHRGLLDQMLATFGLEPEWDLDAMRPDQGLPELTGRLLPAIGEIIQNSAPAAVLAQGDTTTVFCAALAAFYAKVPFGHVEAGLRSGDLTSPFPEEGMRRLSAVLSRWHFAPTDTSRDALVREGIPEAGIHVVGNTVIDALLATAQKKDLPPIPIASMSPNDRLVLVTLHRRENFGAPLHRALGAIHDFAAAHPEAKLLYPVHPNPNVQGPARAFLEALPNVHLTEPLDYPTLVSALKQSYLVLTDSGGLQEEAPALGKPVLVFRDVTERPEAVTAGGVFLVGTDPDKIRGEIHRLWADPEAYDQTAKARFPYGDGHSAERITIILESSLAE